MNNWNLWLCIGNEYLPYSKETNIIPRQNDVIEFNKKLYRVIEVIWIFKDNDNNDVKIQLEKLK
jgi:hypothetical protein